MQDAYTFEIILDLINDYIEGSNLKEQELNKVIDKIDTGLVLNIDKLLDSKEEYGIQLIKKMKKLKEEIKHRGVGVFSKLKIRRDTSVSNTIELCEELYGECDEEKLVVMKFAKSDKQIVTAIATIIRELMAKSNGDINIKNIELAGVGGFSQALKIGDYILKIGDERATEYIPNDKRILQPIIRQYIEPKKHTHNNFIEIQNAVDADWWHGMTDKEIDDILYKIYEEMRERGKTWYDLKKENVGRLLKPNRINYKYRDIDGTEKDLRPTKSATGFIENEEPDEILEAGEYVIIDTDLIKLGKNQPNLSTKKFEERYKSEKYKKNLEERKNNSKSEWR